MVINVKLSTSEIASMWTNYMNDSMAACVLKHFLQHVIDSEIEKVVRYGLHLSEQHIKTIEQIFSEENVVIPDGFNEKNDVNLSAPQLFSESYYLLYLHNMAKIGSNGYSLSLSNSTRVDIRKFYTECLESSAELFNKTTEVLLSKGLFMRPPQINYPNKVDYVKQSSFLTGWLGDRRPLSSIEIMNLHFNIERNEIGKSLVMGLSQVAVKQEVVDYLIRAKIIAGKHIEIFGSLLSDSDLPAPMTWDTLPTNSTTETFSDKLIMFHVAALTGASVSHYGTSLGTSPRRDIGLHYNRLMQEVLLFAEDGANIMINNGWMEQPPQASDRNALAQQK
jgi:hypothetical protein